MKCLVPACWVLIILSGCTPKNQFTFVLEGTVKNARTLAPVSGLELSLSQQVLSSGTFNENFNYLTGVSTDASGNYAMEFPRENAVAYRLNTSDAPYIARTFSFDQDDFTIDEPNTFNFSVFPEAFIEVHLSNQLPSAPSDLFRFRFDQVNFDCQCCNGEWKQFAGTETDTTFGCRLYGDTWLHYVTQYTSETTDTLIADSVWCPAFQTAQLFLAY